MKTFGYFFFLPSILLLKFTELMGSASPVNLKSDNLMSGWTNFYRSEDWSSNAYFYLDKPVNELPELSSVEIRTYKLKQNTNEIQN